MLPGGGVSQELKARAGSYTVSRATAAFASFPSRSPILSWHVVLMPCPGQALPDFLPGPQFSPAGSLIVWNQSGFWAQKNMGWNLGPILISGVISGKRLMPVELWFPDP